MSKLKFAVIRRTALRVGDRYASELESKYGHYRRVTRRKTLRGKTLVQFDTCAYGHGLEPRKHWHTLTGDRVLVVAS